MVLQNKINYPQILFIVNLIGCERKIVFLLIICLKHFSIMLKKLQSFESTAQSDQFNRIDRKHFIADKLQTNGS